MEAYYEQQVKSDLASGGWTAKLKPEASTVMTDEWDELFVKKINFKNYL